MPGQHRMSFDLSRAVAPPPWPQVMLGADSPDMGFSFGHFACIGARASMEDRVLCEDLTGTQQHAALFPGTSRVVVVGVVSGAHACLLISCWHHVSRCSLHVHTRSGLERVQTQASSSAPPPSSTKRRTIQMGDTAIKDPTPARMCPHSLMATQGALPRT